MTSSWIASKDYLNFSIFCRSRFECVTLASALIDVAKKGSLPPPHPPPPKVCVLECLWITFHSELLACRRSLVVVVKISGLLQKAVPWSPAHACWLPFWLRTEDKFSRKTQRRSFSCRGRFSAPLSLMAAISDFP